MNMKKLMALSLAAVMAAASMAATTTSASARNGYWLGGGGYGGFGLFGGYGGYGGYGYNNFPLGLFFGPMQPYVQPYPYYGYYARPYRAYPIYPRRYAYNYQGNGNVAWCAARYRTYNPATNMFFVRRGVLAVCRSPYQY
jgi:hypothetical protein